MIKENLFCLCFRLEQLCPSNGSKIRTNINTDVSVFTLNSSQVAGQGLWFNCHLELLVPSYQYGFSIFIEEMSLSGYSLQSGGCSDDFIQFGRDILFLTTHKSRKYCGEIELPVARTVDGIKSLEFPFTPLANRIYNEEEDREMDIWIQVALTGGQSEKSISLVVTPFKKSCATRDNLYRQCRYSTKCVRKELFCDGRINCAWPYSEPAGDIILFFS